MSSDTPPPANTRTATAPPGSSDKAASAGLGELARKIRSRTTDLLAIGVVLIAGLTLGRQVISWWRVDDVPAPSAAPDVAVGKSTVWGEDGSAVDLQFGDSPMGLSRQTIAGNRQQALQRLSEICSEKTRGATIPNLQVRPQEQKLLERLSRSTPVSKEPGIWEVYVLEQPLPLAVGVRFAADPAGKQVVGVEEVTRRVVCWGWLFPRGKENFTAYCVQSAERGTSNDATSSSIPLPPGSHRLLSVRGAREGELISFSGPGPGDAWRNFFDDWSQKRGAGPIPWQRAGTGWSARVRDVAESREITWQLAPRNNGSGETNEWLGLVDLIPIREPRGNQ